mmetsp:Transcript_43696/g.102784  ORF Transcript_43696/g.102784 Transcript_43696/m.102784 type:complete len:272 (-) Transcript_43696:30-845(-)
MYAGGTGIDAITLWLTSRASLCACMAALAHANSPSRSLGGGGLGTLGVCLHHFFSELLGLLYSMPRSSGVKRACSAQSFWSTSVSLGSCVRMSSRRRFSITSTNVPSELRCTAGCMTTICWMGRRSHSSSLFHLESTVSPMGCSLFSSPNDALARLVIASDTVSAGESPCVPPEKSLPRTSLERKPLSSSSSSSAAALPSPRPSEGRLTLDSSDLAFASRSPPSFRFSSSSSSLLPTSSSADKLPWSSSPPADPSNPAGCSHWLAPVASSW